MNDTIRHALIWGAVTAVAVTVLQALVDFDPAAITDWRVWATGLGASAVRSGSQALLQALLSGKQEP